MRSPHVKLLLLALPENGRHVETAGTYTLGIVGYGGETPKFSHLNRKKLQSLLQQPQPHMIIN